MTQMEWFLFAILPLLLAVIALIVGEWSRAAIQIQMPLESEKAKVTMEEEQKSASSRTAAAFFKGNCAGESGIGTHHYCRHY